ncbi:MAG: hypothetical protein ACLGHP_04690, partial [Vicinamibacteria bacterium]
VVDPKHVIATLTKEGTLNMELKVNRGRGYQPVTARGTGAATAFLRRRPRRGSSRSWASRPSIGPRSPTTSGSRWSSPRPARPALS